MSSVICVISPKGFIHCQPLDVGHAPFLPGNSPPPSHQTPLTKTAILPHRSS